MVNSRMNTRLPLLYTRTYIRAMNIADRLDLLMKLRKLESQSGLARLAGVPQPTINRILKGKTENPDLPTLQKLAVALNSTAAWIADGTGPGPENPDHTPKSTVIPGIGNGGLADRIKSLLKDIGGDEGKLAAGAQADIETVRNWLNGVTPRLDVDHAVALQTAFGVNSVWLMLGKGPRETAIRYNDAYEPIPVTGWRGVPVVGMAQLGDNEFWADVEYPVGHGDGFVDVPTKDREAYALRCVGDSMRPRIKDREFVVIEPNHEIEPGDEVLVKAKDGRVMVKEFLYKRAGRIHLISVNEAHGTVAFKEEEIEKMHYVGWIAKPSAWRPD
jgi:phage repressor protein C with HTH and peptisase S24 domain